jgi:hypothetical protein
MGRYVEPVNGRRMGDDDLDHANVDPEGQCKARIASAQEQNISPAHARSKGELGCHLDQFLGR